MKCIDEGMHGAIRMPSNIFEKLNADYFITHCTKNIKYMCANEREKIHLESLGVDLSECCCDWFKIYRNDT